MNVAQIFAFVLIYCTEQDRIQYEKYQRFMNMRSHALKYHPAHEKPKIQLKTTHNLTNFGCIVVVVVAAVSVNISCCQHLTVNIYFKKLSKLLGLPH
jgi:hypothetical protein